MKEGRRELVVPEAEEGRRLDHFLTATLEGHSRSFLQQLIKSGRVTVDGRAAKAGHSLRGGETVAVEIPAAEAVSLEGEDIPLNLVYQDEDLAVVDKQAGLVVHPGAGHSRGTLVHALLHHLDDLSGIGGELRPGIVHRLDRDTSGLMVVAKNDRAHRALSDMLARREIHRSYQALVWGHLDGDEGIIEGAVGRDPRHRQRMAVREEGGKMAVTRYSRLESLPDFDYIRLDLETGRTHQIRVHLSWLGHPVLGDPLYGGRRGSLRGRSRRDTERLREVLARLERQALHAYRLAFAHPVTDRPLEFESPLPGDFRQALEKLRQN